MGTKRTLQSFDLRSFLATADVGRTIATYNENQALFSQGESGDAVYYVQSGKVKVTVLSSRGKEGVVAILGKGEFVGEGCLTSQRKRTATAVAMTECVIMRIDKVAIQQVLKDQPRFAERFISHLLARSVRTEADLVDQLFNSSEKRLARILLLMGNIGKAGQPDFAVMKISQETLAEMVGTTRSRVNFFMNKFRKLGFVEYNGLLTVHSGLMAVLLQD